MLPDVKLESIRGPAAESLNAIIGPALTGKEGRTAGAKRVTTERGGKEVVEAGEEPRASGDLVLHSKPQIREISGRGSIPAGEIVSKNGGRINGEGEEGWDDDQVTLKEAISFVRGERVTDIG